MTLADKLERPTAVSYQRIMGSSHPPSKPLELLHDPLSTVLTHGLGESKMVETYMAALKDAEKAAPFKLGKRNLQSPDQIMKSFASSGNALQMGLRMRAVSVASPMHGEMVQSFYRSGC